MNVKLVPKIPSKDGYYLMRFTPSGGLHLVIIQTRIDGSRVLLPDNPSRKMNVEIGINEAHASVFAEATFSETPIQTSV